MHFNENTDREQAMTLEGTAVYRIMHPKSRKGPPTTKPVKAEPTFGSLRNVPLVITFIKCVACIYKGFSVWC